MKVYPNPVSEFIIINYERQNEGIVWIRDLQGHEVFAQKFSENRINIDIRGMAPGIYILVLQSGTNKINVKFIKK